MSRFVDGLIAAEPAPSVAGNDPFGRLVGSWRVRNRFRRSPDGAWSEDQRIWTFARIVGGRAVQDVIVSESGEVAGTTVRAFDPALDAWRVEWFGTQSGTFCTLRARADGPDVVRQEGVEHLPGGDVPIRWDFTDVGDSAFTWTGSTTAGEAGAWWVEQRMDAVRL